MVWAAGQSCLQYRQREGAVREGTDRMTRLARGLSALCVACACAGGATAIRAAAPHRPPSPPAEVSYSGCLERIARNHDAFILANVTRNQPGQPPRGYDVLSGDTLRLGPPADGTIDFSTWEGYVVVATGTLATHPPIPKDPLFRNPWGKRFASLPLLTVTAYKHLAGTLPCPA